MRYLESRRLPEFPPPIDRRAGDDMLHLDRTLNRAGVKDTLRQAADTVNERLGDEATRVISHRWLGQPGSDITAIKGYSLACYVDHVDDEQPRVHPAIHVLTYTTSPDNLQTAAYVGIELFGSGQEYTSYIPARLDVHLGTDIPHPIELTQGYTREELTGPDMISALFYAPRSARYSNTSPRKYDFPPFYAQGHQGITLHSTNQLEHALMRALRPRDELTAYEQPKP